MLLQEVLECFGEVRLRTFIDGTLGAGGHAAAIASHHQVGFLTSNATAILLQRV